MTLRSLLAAAIAASGTLATAPVQAQDLEKLSIVVFGPPSLGAFLPPVIKAQKFDEKHGLSITFVQRPPDAYAVQFNSGQFKLGGSAALLTVGLADTRGVKVTYLFNVFDFWGGVVTSRPEIKSLKDLEGKQLAAATGTTNYKMFTWLAKQQGVDAGKIRVVNTAPPGLVGYALANRAAAVELWEPAYTTLLSRKPGIRTLDLKIAESWKKFTGSAHIPYLGVAAHISWVEKNQNLVPKLFAAYKDAAAWIVANPAKAGNVILPKGKAASRKAIGDLIKANDRLGINVSWASDLKIEITSVYAAGRDIGYLAKDPSGATIYEGNSK